MFEEAEKGRALTKKELEEALPALRVDLVNAQYDLRDRDFSVLILLMGDDRIGLNETVGRLHEWMDARYIDTRFFGPPSDEERERPHAWRYWRAMPADGRIGLFIGAWALATIDDRLCRTIDDERFDHRIAHILRLEEALVNDGTLVLKLWLHAPKDEVRRRLIEAIEHPSKGWRVDEEEWRIYEQYDVVVPLGERFLRATDVETHPWTIVESTDVEYRDLTVARTIRDALVARLADDRSKPSSAPTRPRKDEKIPDALSNVDLDAALPDEEFDEALRAGQAELDSLARRARRLGVTTVLVFEGWDAAGKGGCIRRLTQAMEAQDYQVVPIAAPTDEESAHHWLWRFWRHLPRAGRVLIYDRSWYGRVLVERVEGFAREDEWRRAYDEIADFEQQLIEHGIVLAKFWLHVSAAEQRRRFEAREKTAYKKYKITDEDYRNRQRRDDYTAAVNEMVARTGAAAPWTIVAAEDKRFARIEVLRAVCERLHNALD